MASWEPRPARAGAVARLVVGVVLIANADSILLTDRTYFEAPPGMSLPAFKAGSTVVVEYDIVEGRNILASLPGMRA
ncbi:MAG TPA: hypothetical protein VJX92_27250 [Methylomirabilota bacterium]|nr:hypothetical protein [Methylomirabilota bacterium]